ncbi:polygalacturonase QRT2-like [Salvia splendens]|uniref:polygalacturonase QRT2-like n=1 Tax=Salvia splendens TaxID=180675 RepID=UPI001C25DC24|nr:polygalacturonase QRT2-like [Salvia splendens]
MKFVVLLFVLVSSSSPYLAWAFDEATYFNVTDYGAIGDGRTESSKAFLKAWDAACKDTVKSPTVYVPPKSIFLVNPVNFNGPCNGPGINLLILGTIVAPNAPSAWDGKDASQWLAVTNTKGLSVVGFGVIDGQGKAWWDQSCKYHPKLKNCTTLAPTAWKFIGCNNSIVSNIRFINSAQTHISVQGCNGFLIQNVTIESPGNSPNTDGIHIQSTHHLSINDSKITNGDDCISIGDHSSHLSISNIQCTLGHGISIGSLGRSGNLVQVENINVTNCIFNDTTNGARIKTWQVGRGYLKHIAFERLTFNNVKNPIIIDQNYCDVSGACPELKTGVQISNVSYRHAVGTSATHIAINLNCSKSVPCHGISMESVQLTSAITGKQVTANCSNAYGREHDIVPGPCLPHETHQDTMI